MGRGCRGRPCEAPGEIPCRTLRDLVRWEAPLDETLRDAAQCDRVPGAPVVFGVQAARSVLERCVSGELPVRDLPRWAGAVHMLERVELDDAQRDLLATFLFEISTPELFDPVTVPLCRTWTARLT